MPAGTARHWAEEDRCVASHQAGHFTIGGLDEPEVDATRRDALLGRVRPEARLFDIGRPMRASAC